jgi:hypothetical protein
LDAGKRIRVTQAGIVELETGHSYGLGGQGDTWQYVLVPAGTYTIVATMGNDDNSGNSDPIAALQLDGVTGPKSVIFADQEGLDGVGAACAS